MGSRKIAIMASGDGTNAEAIMQWCQKNPQLAQVVVLLSDQKDAYVLTRAQNYKVPCLCMSYPTSRTERPAHEEKMSQALLEFGAEWVFLAGFMRVLGKAFLRPWASEQFYKIANIHPSLLPAFKGAHAYQDAFEEGVKNSGVTIHLVTEALDNGPILLQKSFPRHEDDDFNTFKARGRSLEGPLWHEFLELWSRGQLMVPSKAGGHDAISSL